jgi:hypothetical protein
MACRHLLRYANEKTAVRLASATSRPEPALARLPFFHPRGGSVHHAVTAGRASFGIDPDSEQTWQRYGTSIIIFSAFALDITYLIFRLQGSPPFNPQHLGAVGPALAWNTAVSFVTNTNWQAYSGEATMSQMSQMGSLAVQTSSAPRWASPSR